MGYVKINVNKPVEGAWGGDHKDRVFVVDLDDLIEIAARDGSGIVISGHHVMHESVSSVEIYMDRNSFEGNSNSEGDSETEGFIQTVKFEHPGKSVDVLEFRQNWINRNAIILVEKASENKVEQYGDITAPLRMKVEGLDNKDNNKSIFTFKSMVKGPDLAIYQGDINVFYLYDRYDDILNDEEDIPLMD